MWYLWDIWLEIVQKAVVELQLISICQVCFSDLSQKTSFLYFLELEEEFEEMIIMKSKKSWKGYFWFLYYFMILLMIAEQFWVKNHFVSEMGWEVRIFLLDVSQQVIKNIFFLYVLEDYFDEEVKYLAWLVSFVFLKNLSGWNTYHVVHNEPVSLEPYLFHKNVDNLFVVNGDYLLVVERLLPLNWWDLAPDALFQNIFAIFIWLNRKQFR